MKKVGSVAYMIALPSSINKVHLIFHVTMLKKYHRKGDYFIHWDLKLFDKELYYEDEPISILDKDVTKFKTRVISYKNI